MGDDPIYQNTYSIYNSSVTPCQWFHLKNCDYISPELYFYICPYYICVNSYAYPHMQRVIYYNKGLAVRISKQLWMQIEYANFKGLGVSVLTARPDRIIDVY